MRRLIMLVMQENNYGVILNDNQMSISPNVGAMRNYLMKISTNKYYNYIRKKIALYLI
ncbi:MAG: hypothetical protein Ct9H90mP15_02060 [Candidatus Neomarinimicrobiota bacterium]|nr:MAG: hypothetical protein Ct9H90mP15_02060 [Candidatus Neomarinimicrobiota bacterium]